MPQRPVSRIIAERPVLTAAPHDSVRSAAQKMSSARVGAVLVVDAGRLVGVFTERDALARVLAQSRDPDTTQLAEVMTRDPLAVSADTPFSHALHIMHDNGFRHVPVVDGGRPLGVVSARDALGLEVMEFESELRRRDRIGQILG